MSAPRPPSDGPGDPGSPPSRPTPSPGLLCWRCRRLSPFPAERCAWCQAPFLGNVGGAYRDMPPPEAQALPPPPSMDAHTSSRSVEDLLADLRRIRDAARRQTFRGAATQEPAPRYACGACGRLVAADAAQCACGAVFEDASQSRYACPKCGRPVPGEASQCPGCGVAFLDAEPPIPCPRCGLPVAADASQCGCGRSLDG